MMDPMAGCLLLLARPQASSNTHTPVRLLLFRITQLDKLKLLSPRPDIFDSLLERGELYLKHLLGLGTV